MHDAPYQFLLNMTQLMAKEAVGFLQYLRAASTQLEAQVAPYNQTMNLPPVPVIHPYNPLGDDITQARIDGGVPKFPLVINLDINPEAGSNDDLFKEELGVANITRYIVMQSNPWPDKTPLLLRPHPWVHSTAPGTGDFDQKADLDIFVAYPGRSFAKLPGDTSVTTHNVGNDVVFSPNNLGMPAEVCNPGVTNKFYSACVDKHGDKAAITLHILLNDHDLQLVENALIHHDKNLGHILSRLETSPTINLNSLTNFLSGYVPVIAPDDNEKLQRFFRDHEHEIDPNDPNRANQAGATALTLALSEAKPDPDLIFCLLRNGAIPTHFDLEVCPDELKQLLPPIDAGQHYANRPKTQLN